VQDLVDAMQLTPEALQARIAFVREKILTEQKARRCLFVYVCRRVCVSVGMTATQRESVCVCVSIHVRDCCGVSNQGLCVWVGAQIKAGAEKLAPTYVGNGAVHDRLRKEVYEQLQESTHKLALLQARDLCSARQSDRERQRGNKTVGSVSLGRTCVCAF
jgi:hypothetical protein